LADGTEAYATSGERLGYFETRLPAELFSPLPSATGIDPSRIRLIHTNFKVSKSSYSCVSEALLKGDNPQDFRMLPTQCFDPMIPVLSFGSSFQGVVITTYDNVAKFQGKFLARAIQTVAGQQKLFNATVDAVGPFDPSVSALTPAKDAILKPDPVQSTGQVKIGSLVKRQQPQYPPEAKLQRQQGTVLIDAIISTDGKIKDPRVISSPSPLLSASSLDAISHWEYEPYLLNGAPVEVDTMIAMTFVLPH
jgi:TonB family protein